MYHTWLEGCIGSIGSIATYRDDVYTMGGQHYLVREYFWVVLMTW